MRPRFQTILLVAAAALGSCRAPSAPAADTQAIDALRDRVQAGENAGQPDSMAVLMATDVQVMPPNGATISGRAAFAEFVRNGMQSLTFHVEYQSQEVVVSGDWAFDRGTYAGVTTPKAGGAAVTDRGRYLWLLQRQPDRTWQYARVIWNADAPVPAAP